MPDKLNRIPGIGGTRDVAISNKPTVSQRPEAPGAKTFAQTLTEELRSAPVKFSAHAQTRLSERRIQLSRGEMDRLVTAVDLAASKGARESLILVDNNAFVVSVRNRTVITALHGESMKDTVFTNIDSAVIT